ncbi:hypothetical protein [Bradyrhizobium septentrionale]|uniref:Uncharacterized protein n=1 Tax=Bradyrhizobium septentrionale TaxID=1404411 RepID=A0ABZ2P3T6_9BRAD
MNHSIYSADRKTHMKIVVAALVANIGVASFGIAVRIKTGDGYSQTSHVIKVKSRHQDTIFATAILHPELPGSSR